MFAKGLKTVVDAIFGCLGDDLKNEWTLIRVKF